MKEKKVGVPQDISIDRQYLSVTAMWVSKECILDHSLPALQNEKLHYVKNMLKKKELNRLPD